MSVRRNSGRAGQAGFVKAFPSFGLALITSFILLLGTKGVAQQGKPERLTEKQLLAVLDCISRPGYFRISKNYSGEGISFRYAYEGESPGVGDMGLIVYKAGQKYARYYLLLLDWNQRCPVIQVNNGADLYQEKGRWQSDIPFRYGGLGTMRMFAELPEAYAKRKLHFVLAKKIKRTCAKYDQGG